MKASILAVGTELTTGQIINRNASAISAKLKPYGVQTLAHLTIPDKRLVILESLKYLEASADLIFITGGLGPTSDDFTRDLVAEWAGLEMKFDETSWNYIVERLTSRGYQVRESQRQQCYFPIGAKILINSEGTAHGFQFSVLRPTGQKTIFVLPGPPREIEAIWKDHLSNWLKENTRELTKSVTKAWDTLGVGESEVAHLVEAALTGRPDSENLEIGYRVHLPYVEVKLTFPENEGGTWQNWITKVDEVLKKITITRDFTDVAEVVTKAVKNIDFTFYDYASEGYLHSRLSPFLRGQKKWSFKQSFSSDITADFFEQEDQFLAIFPYEEDKCVVVFSINGHRILKNIEAPMKSPLMSERRKQYFAEMALVEVSKTFKL
ncbi:MAG: competence/damage-inducible protein A [Bdellovibrio sp.]|nr:competence/damage-inducible protein A [Bdellovibrio sp.]